MSTAKQYIVDQPTWIGRELKAKGDPVMLTKDQAKYVPVTLDPKWTPPAQEVEGDDDSTVAPKTPATPTKTDPKK
jgi:hypothetical protein